MNETIMVPYWARRVLDPFTFGEFVLYGELYAEVLGVTATGHIAIIEQKSGQEKHVLKCEIRKIEKVEA